MSSNDPRTEDWSPLRLGTYQRRPLRHPDPTATTETIG